jgi:hypothetical protein
MVFGYAIALGGSAAAPVMKAEAAMLRLDAVGRVMSGPPVNLNHPGHYLHWGVIQISVANFVVIVAMIVVFVAALLVPFPKGKRP